MIQVKTKIPCYQKMGVDQFNPEIFTLIDWLKENIGEANKDWNLQDSSRGVWVVVWNEANAALVALRWS
jgi:hypothetical protein